MNAKYSRTRFDLLAGIGKDQRKTEMKRSVNDYRTYFIAMLLLLFASGNVMAGGLVDTSVDRFTAADFTDSEEITNPWWTLTGAHHNFLYLAQDGDDCEWNLTEVLGSTGPLPIGIAGSYAGVNARIVLDRSWVDEGCTQGTEPEDFVNVWQNLPAEEVTYDWYAQDSEKNIWYMGENTFDGDYGGSFTAGCDGAEAGIVLLGNPSKGAFYSQEFYEGEAEDLGKVLNFIKDDNLTCMKTKEWSPLEHGAIEHKFYCSDGITGELSVIEELKGKTLIVELVDYDVAAPPPPPADLINPTPMCPPFTQP